MVWALGRSDFTESDHCFQDLPFSLQPAGLYFIAWLGICTRLLCIPCETSNLVYKPLFYQ